MRRQLFRQPSQNQDRLIRSHRLVLSQFGSGGFSVKNRPTFPVDFNFLDRITSVKEKPSLIGSETPQKASDGDRFGIRFFTSRPNQAADASDSLPAIGRLAGFFISNLGLNSFPQCDQRADSGNCSQRVGWQRATVRRTRDGRVFRPTLGGLRRECSTPVHHTELVRLAYKDFEGLVSPKLAHFALAGVR